MKLHKFICGSLFVLSSMNVGFASLTNPALMMNADGETADVVVEEPSSTIATSQPQAEERFSNVESKKKCGCSDTKKRCGHDSKKRC